MAKLPTGSVTLLFSNIERSVAHLQQPSAGEQAALVEYRTLLIRTCEAMGGRAIETRYPGILMVFADARQALDAALNVHQVFAEGGLPETLPLRVRMALHSSQSETSVAGDRWPAEDHVACLATAAHDGQVLLSDSAQHLVAPRLPAGVTLRDLGLQQPPGLQQPDHIYQLLAPGLSTEFPPLGTFESRQHNLPQQPTPFVGRERDILALRERLLRPDVRLLTLTGAGGTGKTRLALQVGAAVLDEFADGVWFVNLAPIATPELVPTTIAHSLGVKENGGQAGLDALKHYLRRRMLLLLLDNFEQVLDAAPLLSELLAEAPGLKILATSRAYLHLTMEQPYPVSALTLPEQGHSREPEMLQQSEAVMLFVQRAQVALPAFQLTMANASAVAGICRRLEGLPLAIELAAARVKLLPPAALLARLEHRLNLLTGGPRDLPARQQALRSTIDWSYSLLSAEEQMLFRWLSVFVGGWTLDAAEAIWHRHTSVLDLMQALLDKSLLQQIAGLDDEPRFTMLETLREYAQERLQASGEADELQRRHAAFFRNLVEHSAPELDGSRQAMALRRLNLELDNIRAALLWSLGDTLAAGSDLEVGVSLAETLYWFWYLSGRVGEGRAWSERALSKVDSSQPTPTYARALFAAGALALFQGDLRIAGPRLEQSIPLFRQHGDNNRLASALFILAVVTINQMQKDRAVDLLKESQELFAQLGDKRWYATTLMHMGDIALDEGDYASARLRYETGVAIQYGVGDRWLTAQLMNNLGEVERCLGNYTRSAHFYRESLALFQELGTTGEVARSLHNQGYIMHAEGDDEAAAAFFAQSLALYQELGNQRGIAECLTGLGVLAAARNAPRRAARLWGGAEALRQSAGADFWPADREIYAKTLSEVRAKLDAPLLAAAWNEGRTMPLDQALAEAGTPIAVETTTPPTRSPASSSPIKPATSYPNGLTEREVEVLRLVARGLTNKEVAEALIISPRTVNAHLNSIYAKLGVNSRSGATRFAVEHQI